MTSILPQCMDCKHLIEGQLKCSAFPRGIPMQVLENVKTHDHVLEGQEGTDVHEPNKQILVGKD